MAAIQKVVVPIYCTSFLAVEEEKQQKITRVSNTPKPVSVGVNPATSCRRNKFSQYPCPYHSMKNVQSFQLLQLWEKNSYFDEETIQQLQNPALGLGQYQVSASTAVIVTVFLSNSERLPLLPW